MKNSILTLAVIFSTTAFACGTPNPTDASSSTDATDAHVQASKPACEEIARRCHAFDEMPGTGQMCHRFAEDPTSSNVICMSMQMTCFSACPVESDGGVDSGVRVDAGSATDAPSATDVVSADSSG